MTAKNTGFHPHDADYTRGRAHALADADAISRRQMGLVRLVKLTPLPGVQDE
jgi:hypothetical protein